jgi:hypothetical protein
VVSSATLIGEPTVSREEPASNSLRLDAIRFKQFVTKSNNSATKVLSPLPLEPSILSSLSATIKSVKRKTTTLEPVTLKLVLSTPTYTLGRKRTAVATYTSFRSSSYKTRKTTTSSSLSKVVKVIECKCNIAEP